MVDRTIEHDPDSPDGCADCPLFDDEWSECAAEDPPRKVEGDDEACDYRAPSWCPLRSGAVIVRAKGAT